jgi:hypothetical protein
MCMSATVEGLSVEITAVDARRGNTIFTVVSLTGVLRGFKFRRKAGQGSGSVNVMT